MHLASNTPYAFSSWSGGAWVLLLVIIMALIGAWKGRGKFRYTAIGVIAVVVALGTVAAQLHK